MMFQQISDPNAIETTIPTVEEGLGFIEDEIIFQKEKVLKQGDYTLFGKKIKGFEIHHGVSKKYPLSFEKGKIKGTFVHGLFEDEVFESYKKKAVNEFVETMKTHLNIEKILNGVA